jgi:hypothetical protein
VGRDYQTLTAGIRSEEAVVDGGLDRSADLLPGGLRDLARARLDGHQAGGDLTGSEVGVAVPEVAAVGERGDAKPQREARVTGALLPRLLVVHGEGVGNCHEGDLLSRDRGSA